MTFARPIDALRPQLEDWLPAQRWFAGKDRAVRSATFGQLELISEVEPLGVHAVVEVAFADGGPDERYQLLIGVRSTLPPELEHVRIGEVDGLVAYDGIWDHHLAGELLRMIAGGERRGDVRFSLEPGTNLDTGMIGRVPGAEQSNTSVVYGSAYILKLFRRIHPGRNPDLDIGRALRSVGCRTVPQLLGAIEGTLADGSPVTFGVLHSYAANSADGWSMAQASVRDLFSEGDLHADEVGGDFAGEAHRLGESIAVIHTDLAAALGSSAMDDSGPAELSRAMRQRLREALPIVPDLAEHEEALRTRFDAVAGLTAPIRIQRVHGDLHLGQTLRTPTGWLVIDFEGEPNRPLAGRCRPDSTLRDVAGMLRSFDYAAYYQLQEWEADGPDSRAQLTWRAQEWTQRNRRAFCDGYAAAYGADPREHDVLLTAYELDKAVYEAVYDTQHRPGWAAIPLRSLRRLSATDSSN